LLYYQVKSILIVHFNFLSVANLNNYVYLCMIK